MKAIVNPYAKETVIALRELAKLKGVTEMYLFGSATTFNFKFWQSDIDIGLGGSEEAIETVKHAVKDIDFKYEVDIVSLNKVAGQEVTSEIRKGFRLL